MINFPILSASANWDVRRCPFRNGNQFADARIRNYARRTFTTFHWHRFSGIYIVSNAKRAELAERERATHRALKDLRAPFPKSKEPYFFKGTNAVKQVLQEELQLSTEELLSSQEEDRRRARKARQTGEEEVSPGFWQKLPCCSESKKWPKDLQFLAFWRHSRVVAQLYPIFEFLTDS